MFGVPIFFGELSDESPLCWAGCPEPQRLHCKAVAQLRVLGVTEAPGPQPLECRLAPDRQVVCPAFPLQIGGLEVETPPVVVLPAPLRGETQALVRIAVMRAQRVARLGKPGKHELPPLDKRRPDIRAHDIDAEREKAVTVWCDEPPPVTPPFRAKEPSPVKIGALQQSP